MSMVMAMPFMETRVVSSLFLGLAPVCAGGMGSLFVLAGFAKLKNHDTFLTLLAGYRLLPAFMLEPMAWGLGIVELLAGLAMMSGRYVLWGGVAITAMLVIFALAMSVNLMRGRTSLSCGCTPGITSEFLSWKGVGRTLAYIPLAIVPLYGQPMAMPFIWCAGVVAGLCIYLLWFAAYTLPKAQPALGGR
ncbi:MauE/DoxX family redox-associated membrane protein [Acetobacter okinawensis]|uniref:MauE/DoxX family redox-associated membrane protein n=1 Tax=Acetobacter okinawensis TaxID=1076594 RepID=UPI001F5968B9|nr:MauE/DoxX family redox-associated membrane protein [Acetobacter okinawensis]